MSNTNTTTPPTPHLSLQDAADLLRSYGWTPGQITAITEQTELDWIESRERCYRLADHTDAKAARLAAMEAAPPPQAAPPPTTAKRKRMKKAQGMESIFGQAA